MTLAQVDIAILTTLAYASLFDAALAQDKLYSWLITSTPISKSTLQSRLYYLVKKGLVDVSGTWIGLHRELPSDLDERAVESSEKKKYARSILLRYLWLPTIVGIGITGSVAVKNAKRAEDIDILFVTRPGTLWITRLFVVLTLYWGKKLRTKSSRTVKNLLCCNVWIDETALSMTRQNVYIARELIQIDWLFERSFLRLRLLASNRWVKDSIANTKIVTLDWRPSPLSYLWYGIFPFELMAFLMQRLHMKKTSTKETITFSRAFFHPKDVAGRVLTEFESSVTAICRKYKRMEK